MFDKAVLLHLRVVQSIRVLRTERGAAMVEYSLLIALIAVIAIGAVAVFGDQVSESFSDINSGIDEGINS